MYTQQVLVSQTLSHSEDRVITIADIRVCTHRNHVCLTTPLKQLFRKGSNSNRLYNRMRIQGPQIGSRLCSLRPMRN